MSYVPLIVIGAPRSGTNMLRDALTALPGWGTWPCDEINYIWRHGNLSYPSDAFTPEMARPEVARYVRRRFDRYARSHALDVLVEKTCANSLRVGFVDRVVPDARYLFIVRDGIDAVASAMKRWKATLDPGYIAAKARWVPPTDLPYYGLRYLGNRVHRLFSSDKRLAFWGPRLDGMQELLQEASLAEVCAMQWRACVESAERDFAEIDPSRVLRLRYERFVAEPSAEYRRILDFVGAGEAPLPEALAKVSPKSVGKGRGELGPEGVAELLPRIGDLLERHGYAA